MKGPILVVDDNSDNLKLLVFLLTKNQYSVITADSATSALLAVQEHHPPLILMDVQLPDMSGLELTQMIKKNPNTRDILIVAVTAFAMKADEERALAAGCDGYLAKPIDTRTLPQTVENYLERRRELNSGASC